MGPHDAKLKSLRKLTLSEEPPYALCQNRFQIARTNNQIFGGTPDFFGSWKIGVHYINEKVSK